MKSTIASRFGAWGTKAATLAFAASLCAGVGLAPVARAGPMPQDTENNQSQSRPQKQQRQTFTGHLSPNPDTSKNRVASYVLYDDQRQTNFFLDDKAANKHLNTFENKKVEVTGTLDEATNIIHVSSIKAVS